jgi:protein pelota
MAVRKVQTVSSTGSSDSFRVRINLTLEVAKVGDSLLCDSSMITDEQTTFSSGASSSSATATGKSKYSTASLQISGKVVNENDYVRLGAFHTLDLEGEFPPFCVRQLLIR